MTSWQIYQFKVIYGLGDNTHFSLRSSISHTKDADFFSFLCAFFYIIRKCHLPQFEIKMYIEDCFILTLRVFYHCTMPPLYCALTRETSICTMISKLFNYSLIYIIHVRTKWLMPTKSWGAQSMIKWPRFQWHEKNCNGMFSFPLYQ